MEARKSEQGFALLSVIMLAMLIASLSIGLFAAIRRLSTDGARLVSDVEIRAAAEAGLNRIIVAYVNDGDPLRIALFPDGRAVPWEFGGRKIVLSVQAESGKLDVNAADRAHIAAVLVRLIDDPVTADAILTRIDTTRSAGERIPSIAALLSPFDRMTARRDVLERHLTVMTGVRGVDPRTASTTILEAMPIPDDVRGILLTAKAEGRVLAPGEISGGAPGMFASERPIYTLRADTSTDSGRAGAMQAIVGFPERGPIAIYAWAPAAVRR